MPGIISKGTAAAQMVVKRAPKNEPDGQHSRMPVELQNPVTEHLESYARTNAQRAFTTGITMVGQAGEDGIPRDTRFGKVLALCGAGPSLKHFGEHGTYDEVWACNSALTYLLDRGHHVDVGVAIDQTPMMLEEFITAPDVLYYLASTTDPKLADHLEAYGRQIQWFHNAVGFGPPTYELSYYNEEWLPGFMVGSGATVVQRVIGLAQWLGFRRIDIYGADCAFTDGDVVHASGATAFSAYRNPVIMEGKVVEGGRTWRTRPDMLMGAVDLARKVRDSGGRIRLLGDTLPVDLLGYPDEHLDEVMRRLEPGETPQPHGGEPNG